ncbi:YceI family protein [Dokdonella sp.]|uniref:YceI family protein n=1 Tax=Dokdonella sp. TaxID=2291710 RepID=UPI0027B91E0A|nr:YceI family protein [Dokdonella sp.]
MSSCLAAFSISTALLLGSGLGLPTSAQAAGDHWRFDPAHSQISFSVMHQKFSNALGRVPIQSGSFRFDVDDWSTAQVDVVMDLAAIDMGNAQLDDAARSGALLDTARWPLARYASRSVERIDTNRGVIHGTLDFRGVKRPLDVAFTLNHAGTDPYLFKRKLGFSAHATIHRADFGMNRYADVVGADVSVRIEVEGIAERDSKSTETSDASQE